MQVRAYWLAVEGFHAVLKSGVVVELKKVMGMGSMGADVWWWWFMLFVFSMLFIVFCTRVLGC